MTPKANNNFQTRAMPRNNLATVDQCVPAIKKLEHSDFYGDCILRFRAGKIYQVQVAQVLKAEDIDRLIG
ncbi:MAG: hypothetical protein HY401_09610 [Elusimicrobia bacterium]|nr:hypothetical protein [Elusimicrobiota bacterium]